jgi:hypothetical protein
VVSLEVGSYLAVKAEEGILAVSGARLWRVRAQALVGEKAGLPLGHH